MDCDDYSHYDNTDSLRDQWYDDNQKKIEDSLRVAVADFEEREQEGLCGNDERLIEVIRQVREYFSGGQSGPAESEKTEKPFNLDPPQWHYRHDGSAYLISEADGSVIEADRSWEHD